MDTPVPDEPLTDGLVSLRPWREEDVADLVAAIDGDVDIAQWLELIPQPYREREAHAWVSAAATMWRDGTASTSPGSRTTASACPCYATASGRSKAS